MQCVAWKAKASAPLLETAHSDARTYLPCRSESTELHKAPRATPPWVGPAKRSLPGGWHRACHCRWCLCMERAKHAAACIMCKSRQCSRPMCLLYSSWFARCVSLLQCVGTAQRCVARCILCMVYGASPCWLALNSFPCMVRYGAHVRGCRVVLQIARCLLVHMQHVASQHAAQIAISRAPNVPRCGFAIYSRTLRR